jgi:competence protein ComEC
MFPVGLSVAVGLLLGEYVRLSAVWIGAGVIAAGLLLVPWPGRKRWMGYVLIAILAALYFKGYDHLHRSQLQQWAVKEKTVWVRGVIDSGVMRDGDVVRLYMQVDQWGEERDRVTNQTTSERIALRVTLSTRKQAEQAAVWRKGDRISGVIRLTLPSPARNPHAFDYARFLRWQGVAVTADARFASIQIDPDERNWLRFLQDWQAFGARHLEGVFADPAVSGYMKSLLLGIQEGVEPKLEEIYSDLGLIHVLAISGLHVTLVSACFVRLAEWAGLTRRSAACVTVVLIGLYVLLVGASASAVRAGLMGAVALGSQMVRTRIPVLHIWSLTLTVMLLYNPYQLWHIGFQLSFAVTLGLILYAPVFQQLPYPRWNWAKSLIGVTVAAQATSFPFLLYWFHQFSPVSWLVNLVAVPILSLVVLPAGYIALLLGLVHPALSFLPATLAAWVLHLVHQPLQFLQQQSIPFSHWPHPHWLWLISFTVLLVAVPFCWRRGYQRPRDVVMYLCLFIFLLILARQPFSGDHEVRITFLDVGQGDSIVVEVGKKAVYLIDGGGTPRFPETESWRERRDPFEVGKDVVIPFLRARGIERIDRLVMTHGDYDHIGGLAGLLPRFLFGAVLVNGKEPKNTEAELIQKFGEQNVPVVTGAPGNTWCDRAQVCWTWLHPGVKAVSDNDASVVLQLTAYGRTILFTGDLEQAGEQELMRSGLLSAVDVLKVGHHGSGTSTSSTFLAAIKPKAAVISAGKHNRYGHPSPAVIKRLEEQGVTIFRTDTQGAITLVIRPEGIYWKTEVPDT